MKALSEKTEWARMSEKIDKRAVLIALAGESGSGKSTSAKLLETKGFHLIELTKRLRRDAEELFGRPTRSQIQEHARQMQSEHGNEYYARLALTEYGEGIGGDIVLDGIRNPDELNYVSGFADRTSRAFCLLAVVIPAETRFERVKGRNREGDPTEFALFRADDRRAQGDGESGFQTNAYLIANAHRHIENSGDPKDLERKLFAAVKAVRADG